MTEQIVAQIISTMDTHSVVALAQALIGKESINPPGNEADIGAYIKNFLDDCGIPTVAQQVEGDRYNVIARLKGSGTAAPLVFTGHMDVVPVSDLESLKWQSPPFSGDIIDGCLYGRGSADMKGGLAAAMTALKLLAEHQIIPPGDLILAATVDEEDLMKGSKTLIQSSLITDARGIIVCEPSNLNIILECRGRSWAEITVHGQSAHASLQGAGNNAIMQAVHLINCLEKHEISYQPHPLLGNSLWQANLIHGGLEPAIVPDSCTVTVDARLVPPQLPAEIWQSMQ